MKYYLISWTATGADGESFSGNANFQSEDGYPADEVVIETLKSQNPKFDAYEFSLQDKLEFNTQEELDNYGLS